jgi:hypothetical protein
MSWAGNFAVRVLQEKAKNKQASTEDVEEIQEAAGTHYSKLPTVNARNKPIRQVSMPPRNNSRVDNTNQS